MASGFLAAAFPITWNGVLLPDKAVWTHGPLFHERVQKIVGITKPYIYNFFNVTKKSKS